MPKPLPMLPSPRPVDPDWKCQQSGECCTLPPEIAMTKIEAQRLTLLAPKTITLQFRPLAEPHLVMMKAGPCPFYAFNTCTVYENRPYNCRRFACMRPDPKSEPFEVNGMNSYSRIVNSRVARRLAVTIQRKAQRWGRKMGWFDDAPRKQRSPSDASDEYRLRGDGLDGPDHERHPTIVGVDG